MDLVEPEFLSRELIEGGIDVHPNKNAIVVHYSVDARVLSENMETMGADIKQCRKIINVTGLKPSTDISELARQVVAKASLISPRRLPEVEQLLTYLLTRKQTKPGFKDKDILSASSRGLREQIDLSQKEVAEISSLIDLNDYLELLYEDIPEKVHGTSLILQLVRNPDNLLEIASNESLFLALTRVLRDDWRKSIELSSNIIYIFFCFSTFSNFHKMLIHYKVGSLCMIVIEHEITRHESLVCDTDSKRRGARSTPGGKVEYEKCKKRMQALEKRQDVLLRVCLYLLYNLAESPFIEQKMINKGIVSLLTRLLSRTNEELIILTVSFLKKLSIYGENKDEMAKEKILKRLMPLLPCENEILMNVSIHLLMNLCFDPVLREEIITLGYLPKLVTALDNETHRLVVLFVLYLISMDDKGRAAFAYTDCVPAIMKLLLESDDPSDPEVLALGINLACYRENAAVMCKGPGLKLLMRKALATQDPLFMKMIRNISQHYGDIKKLFLDFIGEMGQIIVSSHEEDYLVEVLGIMRNITLSELDYEKVLTQLNMLPALVDRLKNPATKDDVKLEIIILCGVFSVDVNCAKLVVEEGLPQLLIDILKVKQDDDEMILQISYTIYQWVLHAATREAVMKTEAPDYFIELLNDKNEDIHKITSEIVNVMSECNMEFAQRVKSVKFCYYNRQWLETVTGQSFIEERDADEDYMDPYYLQMAAELYSPELLYELESHGLTSPTSHPLYSSPAAVDDSLVAYGARNALDNDVLFYGNDDGNDLMLYEDHPAFAMQNNETALSTHVVHTARPPSRLNF